LLFLEKSAIISNRDFKREERPLNMKRKTMFIASVALLIAVVGVLIALAAYFKNKSSYLYDEDDFLFDDPDDLDYYSADIEEEDEPGDDE